MDAATLNCPMCGAATRSGATQCDHCRSRLATTACPACFALIFVGSRHCQHCGAKAQRESATTGAPHTCPRCSTGLDAVALGAITAHECPRCEGLWLDVEAFNDLCADREKQAAVIRGDAPPEVDPAAFKLSDVRYVGCCVCAKLMNRVNFSGQSGVIVDVCKAHGIWFDREELRRIVEFIRAGGLDKARVREREKLEAARRARPVRGPIPPTPLRVGGVGPIDAFEIADVAGFVGRTIWRLLD
ncbi:MAG: zf-TFIIB domain-containing protein [Chthoniobacteraceae bacterium]